MEYLLLLAEDPDIVATDEQRAEAVERVHQYAGGLVADGLLRGGAALRPIMQGRRVRARDGNRRVLDGPFAESKEVIAGYFVVEAPDLESAVKIAAKCPNAEFGSVEVREIVPGA